VASTGGLVGATPGGAKPLLRTSKRLKGCSASSLEDKTFKKFFARPSASSKEEADGQGSDSQGAFPGEVSNSSRQKCISGPMGRPF